MKALIKIFALVIIFSTNYSFALSIIVENDSEMTFEISLIPDGLLAASPKRRVSMVKNRFATIQPGHSKRLNAANVSSIQVKCSKPGGEGKYWYVYNRESAEGLFSGLENRTGKKMLIIRNEGKAWEIRTGKLSRSGEATRR